MSRSVLHRRSWVGGGLLALLPWWGPVADAYRAVEEGNALYGAGQYEAALDEYAIAAQLLPNVAEIALNQGNAWYRRFDYNQALDRYLEALNTTNSYVASRVKYNLGVVKYHQALDSMQSFQDARTATRSAIEYYRDSLRLDRNLNDARYNLELAYQLMQRIDEQRVQGQRNAETRNQKTSENRGQSFPDRARQESGRPDPDADIQEEMPGQQATEAPPDGASSRTQNQVRQAASSQPMSPEAAQEMLETLREKSEAAQNLRQAQQRARMRAAGQEKTW